jgi:hypothetical protein
MSGYSYSYRNFRQDSDRLYNHLLGLRKQKTSSPDELVRRFGDLFVEGNHYPERAVIESLHNIVLSPWSEIEFSAILNRCCYILINYWWSHTDLMPATIPLVAMLNTTPNTPATCPATTRLRTFVKQFTQTDFYAALQDRARVVEESIKSATSAEKRRLRELVPRYPYLYSYFLLSFDTSETGLNTVRQLQTKREQQFEEKLFRYAKHLVQRLQHPTGRAAALEVENPTLLSEDQLKVAIRKFAGKVEGSSTYKALAKQFVESSDRAKSYREVKQLMYEYLVSSFHFSDHEKRYSEHQFNRWLAEQIDTMQPQSDHLIPNRPLLVQTCAHLIDCLIAKPTRLRDHLVFTDMTENLGATFVVGLLLKIVLLCQDAQSNLDALRSRLSHRFAVLLKHYETRVRGEINWLVECLETLLVAFSVQFGQTNFSSWASML